jgi:DNA-directed RNA polymerase specialized sigma24 family protein
VVIYGYLRAVARYDEQEELWKCRFSTIAWRAMNTELYNYWRYLNRKKRKAEALSLDAIMATSDEASLSDKLSSGGDPAAIFEDKLLWLEVFSRLSGRQRKLIQMRLMGYPRQYISRKLTIPYPEIDAALLSVWYAVKGLLDVYRKTEYERIVA